jgi:putative ABC transport system ATP-binding protein
MSTVDIEQETQRGLEIVARDVHVSYDGHEVLRAIDLRVAPGQMVAVTGPSGAGKTTLLWVVAALVKPEQGEVTIDGATRRDRDETAAAGVVLIPQDNALAAVLTAAENVLVPLLAARMRPQDAMERTAWALEIVGLAEAGDQLVEELSGGQQQRVAVARGLAQRGAVVLADEPTSELDAVNRARIVALLRAEAERGAAVVLATHDPEAAAECDAELHLDAGEATWIRRP